MKDWESELASLLDDLSDVQSDLLEVLTEKRQRMASNDLAGMQALQPREEQLSNQLHACHARRCELLARARSHGLEAENLQQLAASAGHSRELCGQIKQTSARMRLLQHQSLANWVFAQRSLLHLSQLLEIIATGGRPRPTYGVGAAGSCHGALVDSQV